MYFKKTAVVGFVAGGLLVGVLGTGLLAASDDAKPAEPAGRDGLCELRIEGQSIESLTLVGPGGPIQRPGKVLHLPAGKYDVMDVTLEGGYQCRRYLPGRTESKTEEWFELTPDRPYTLRVGGPLLPTTKVDRQGKYLELNYDLVDAEGRSYKKSSPTDRSNPPRFVVYEGDREIDSGKFQYG